MAQLRELLFRLQPFWRRRRIETGLSEEIQSHIAMATEANIAAGMSPEEARYAALREFGGVEQIKERYRDERGVRWLEEFFSDIRFAARSLRKSPGFTTVAVLTLALCIGANSAVFSVVHAILLKPYPWPESDRLVQIYNSQPLIGRARTGMSVRDYLDRRDGVAALEESALTYSTGFDLTAINATPEHITGFRVTPSLFPLLKMRPALGRTFTGDDAKLGAPNVVILSDALWRAQFGGNRSIIGTDIRLSGEPYTVIGVMPPKFSFPSRDAKVWVPYVFTDFQKSDRARGGITSQMYGRLKPGATIELVQRELNGIQKANEERLPEFRTAWQTSGFGGIVFAYHEVIVGNVRTMLWLVQGAVAAVLLIGCANVASLLLARGSARGRELAIRAALGAGRFRLIRYLLTESVLLFTIGGLLGLFAALWGVSGLNHLGVGNLPRSVGMSLDSAVLGFTLVCAVVMGFVFGALPAWSATRGGNPRALNEASARMTVSRNHLSLRNALVVSEFAAALVLLATAALLIKSFRLVEEINPGFVSENVLVASLGPSANKGSLEQRVQFQTRLLERVRALPGVTSAAYANLPPLGADFTFSYEIDGSVSSRPQAELHAVHRWVSPDYFTTLGIPLIRGRMFTGQDTQSAGDVVVVDKTLAERHWPGENPVGKVLISGARTNPSTKKQEPRKWEIIGMVAPVKHASLEAPDTKATIYFSNLQASGPTLSIVVRTGVPPAELTPALRAAVLSIDPDLPLSNMMTLADRIERSMQSRRTPMTLLALFAGLALVLASIGVYGVLAFAVGQRTKEIGVRIALGATAANIVRMILRQGATLVALGLVLGLAGYFAVSTVIRKMLFGVETTDYAALVIAPATLALVALAACLIPARRATKVDPIVALRTE